MRTRNDSEFSVLAVCLVTFCVSRRRRKMYCGHARLCVCLSVCLSVYLSAAACTHHCTVPDVTWGSDTRCPLVVQYWPDLQSVHGLHCYGNITRTRNVSEYMLVLALCLVTFRLSRRRRKCIVVTRARARARVCVCVCLSVRGRMPTILHRPGCNLGEW